MVPDEFLPSNVQRAVGGARKRRRSSISVMGIVGVREQLAIPASTVNYRLAKEAWTKLAEEIYEARSKDHEENLSTVRGIFTENGEEILPLNQRCPNFVMILAHILLNKLAFRAQEIDWTSEMGDWGEEESRRVGQSFANFLRKRKTGEVAVDAWRKQYSQLEILFKEVIGFEEFIVTLANSLMEDGIYGTAYRVSVGALLSMIDAETDIYVIATYYQSDELVGQAHALLAMLATNLIFQIIMAYG